MTCGTAANVFQRHSSSDSLLPESDDESGRRRLIPVYVYSSSSSLPSIRGSMPAVDDSDELLDRESLSPDREAESDGSDRLDELWLAMNAGCLEENIPRKPGTATRAELRLVFDFRVDLSSFR